MIMDAPICLIDNHADGQLQVNPRALDILQSINQNVVVVSIVGLYRTGKSYLMNKLAGQKKGFSLGSTIQSHTKGIWMWCVPHPQKPKHTLVLLDTEGLGDVEKGDAKNDSWIFALAVLLSSTFVYNSVGTINQYALEQLHYVSELTELIKVKSKANSSQKEDDDIEDECQFVRYFPNFVWVVRDFTLELKIDGQVVSERQYLEHSLALKSGVSKKVMEYNLPRQCIQNFFPARNCFVFVRPASGKELNEIESLPDSALDPQFIQQTHKFCDHVFQTAEVKKVKGGHRITGRMFSTLVKSYVDTIMSGAVPCLENAVLSMATIENEAAVKEALGHYMTQLNELVKFPVEVRELSDLHGKCEGEALKIFMDRSFKDEDGHYQKRLMEEVAKYYSVLVQKNEEVSLEKCRLLLRELSATLEENLREGVYAQPGGYDKYVQERGRVVNLFQSKPNKGVKAQEALDEFLVSKRGEADAILKADKNLSEAEKKLADEKERAALMEQEKKAADERNLQAEQLLKDQERSHQENMAQMQAKMVEEAENIRKEAEKALESKLKLQEELIEKGFQDKATMMQNEIANLRSEVNESKKKDHILGIVRSVGEGLVHACKIVRIFKSPKKIK
ncbi:guanylate-binding protein 1-like [Ambystoma mexicanum]|uniref:guanylate-binding protein 1-like n=1 Tax=Ambystoma mexicanum TaxID=8296 RepID=UPI0037E87D0B